MKPRRVGIFIFDDVEVLDFAGPFEVFAVTGARTPPTPFNVETVALGDGKVTARNGLKVSSQALADSYAPPEILVIPGGPGTRREMEDPAVLEFIKTASAPAELVLSVCSGALLLGKTGLLSGLRATTHAGAFHELESLDSTISLVRNTRFVDNGKIITSAGVSAGIDMSLYVVGRLLGIEAADETARYMEYDWNHRLPAGP